MLRSWITDARYALRRLKARPTYLTLSVLTLALGVSGTAAGYGIARALLFDPLPYANEGAVGVFWKKSDWSEQEFLNVRGRFPGFAQVALYRLFDVRLQQGDAPARLIRTVTSSAELFDVLGAVPELGRGFRAGDDAPGAERVAVLSWGLWRELGGEASIIGSPLVLDGIPLTVIGVMPRGFWFPDPSVRLWVPTPLSAEYDSFNSTLVGLVEPGIDVRALDLQVAQLTAMLDERFDYAPQWDKTVDPHVTPIREDLIGGIRPALLATLGAMALILLIACSNVAALMLEQVQARTGELAVRFAHGASRARLTQQLVIEALVIAAVAGVVGLALAWNGFRLLTRALPLGAWTETTTPDWTLFMSAMAIALAAALLVVIVPLFSLWRGDLRTPLSGIRTGGLQGRGGRLESGLVVAEVALAVLIASGAALLARSVAKLYALDPGVAAEQVGVVEVIMPGAPLENRRQTLAELTAALGQLPGVRSAGAAQVLPLRGGGYNLPIVPEGQSDAEGRTTEYRIVSPGYLETMGFELLAGRTISDADRGDSERVVVINETLAEQYFAGLDPIGKQLGGDADPARVVGVVANAAERRLTDDPLPVRYVAAAQLPWLDLPQSFVLLADTDVDLAVLLDEARRTVQGLAPDVAVRQTTTMSSVLATAVGPARQVMSLLSLLSGLALTLGAVGVYGVIAHFAARRRRDWAIRVALGLPAKGAVSQVFKRGARLVVWGVVLGGLAAAVLARALSPLLYGVHSVDPIAFAAAASSLLAVGFLAAFVPARRAGLIDPAAVLRE